MNKEEIRYREPDFSDLIRLWWHRRKVIFGCGIAGACIGLIIALCFPKEYTATVKMVAETERQNISTELSGLSSLVGINLGAMRREETLSPDIYPEIIHSTPFLIEMSAIPVDGIPLGNYIPGTDPEDLCFEPATRKNQKLLDAMRKRFSTDVDRKTGMITVSTTLRDPLAAAVAADSLTSKLERYMTDYRTRKAQSDFSFVSASFEDARKKYYEAQQEYARFADGNQYITRESAAVERNRLHNEQQLAYGLYSQLANRLELSRLQLQEQTPVLTVIEPARVPVIKSFPPRLTFALSGLAAGLLLAVSYFFIAATGERSTNQSTDAGVRGNESLLSVARAKRKKTEGQHGWLEPFRARKRKKAKPLT